MEDMRQKFTFCQPRILVGRDRDCTLCLAEALTVSRHHLEIILVEDIWFIRDLESTGGTTLNGVALEPYKAVLLREGDCIVLANSVTILFRMAVMPSPPVPLPNGRSDHNRSSIPAATLLVSSETGRAYRGSSCAGNPSGEFPEDFYGEFTKILYDDPDDKEPGTHTLPDSPLPPASPLPPGKPSNSLTPEKPSRRRNADRGKNKPRDAFRFFRNKKPQAPKTDNIQFRAAAPATLKRGQLFLVKIMAYPEADYERADREQKSLAELVRFNTSSIFPAKLQDTFKILIRSEDFPMEEKLLMLTWNGKYACADADIFLPADYTGEQVRLTARVYFEGRVLTDLRLILQVQAPKEQEVVMEKRPVKTAFISYASKDLDRVMPRIQGLLLGQRDMDVFLDRKDLIRGEHWEPRLYKEIEARDIFYLFWSNNARNSPWVQKELAYAIDKQVSIEPVPLEDPAICPPPEQLQDRHFNDWTLRYILHH